MAPLILKCPNCKAKLQADRWVTPEMIVVLIVVGIIGIALGWYVGEEVISAFFAIGVGLITAVVFGVMWSLVLWKRSKYSVK